MNRRTLVTTIGSIATAGAIGTIGTAVSAQEDPRETTNTTNTTTDDDDDDPPKVTANLGSGVTLRSVERQPGQLVLTIESDVGQTLFDWQDNMAAMVTADDRAADGGVAAVDLAGYSSRIWLDYGLQEIVLDVEDWDGAASVTVSTTEKSVVLATQLPDTGSFDPATWGAVVGGSGAAFAGGAWGTKHYRQRQLAEQDERQVSMIR